MAQPKMPVTAPPARPPRYGLIVAAPEAQIENEAFFTGVKFQPEGCGLSGIDSVDCQGSIGTMDPAAQPSVVAYEPVVLWAADECSTMAALTRDWEGRARRQLAAVESYQLAEELWDGAVTEADHTTKNPYLASAGTNSDTVTNGPSAPVNALACLEAALASSLFGAQGMVHVTPQMLTQLAAQQVVRREGQLWVTPMGHVVVADAGYSGSGPGGDPATAGQWMYGTPMLRVALSPIEVIGADIAEMERTLNDHIVYASRLAVVQWATECAHIAAQTNIPTCLVGGTS